MKTFSRLPLLYRSVYLTIAVLLVVTSVLLADLVLHPFEAGIVGRPFWYRWLLGAALPLLNIGIGWLCLRQAPQNINGSLLMFYGIGQVSASIRASIDISTGIILFQFINGITWTAFFALLLVFPDGRFVPRWVRFPGGVLILFLITSILLGPFASRQLTMGAAGLDEQIYANPYYTASLQPLKDLIDFVNNILLQPIVLCFPLSIVVRYRRARAEEQGKLRGFLFGMLILVVLFISNIFLNSLNLRDVALIVNMTTVAMVYLVPPIAVGNAILRHRLYDIDIIIRRTLIYSILTGILAALYFGAIILTQQVFRTATGQTSDLAIVVSTLLIAALFSPIRRRVQDTIDRRLYRRKYDVEQTLADFQKNLREDVDMATLQANLIGVVSETMQPDKIALWVPSPNESRMTKILSPKNS